RPVLSVCPEDLLSDGPELLMRDAREVVDGDLVPFEIGIVENDSQFFWLGADLKSHGLLLSVKVKMGLAVIGPLCSNRPSGKAGRNRRPESAPGRHRGG